MGDNRPAAEGATLFEREGELSAIEQALDVVARGEGACLAISGPAGVGKTALIAEARDAVSARRMLTLTAGGAELEREFAYGVVRQLLEPALAGMRQDGRPPALEGAAEGALALLEGPAPEPVPTSEAGGFATLHALYWFAVTLAERGPLALFVDDAHLADRPSLRFLAFLARRLEGQPILLTVGLRDEEAAGAKALEGIRAAPGARSLRPAPLATKGAAGLLAKELGVAADPGFAAACHTATGGNPFLLVELANTIAAERMEPVETNVALVERLGPASVSRAVLARLAGLGDERVALARSVAVLGGRAELRDAAALAGLDDAAASAAADGLVAIEVFARGRPLEFVHAIVRQAIYGDVAPGERASAHARAARLLAERQAEPERIASHLRSTEPSGDEWTFERLSAAGERALAQGSPAIAIEFLRRALEEPPSEHERPELLARLGSVEVRAGRRQGIPRLRDAHAITIEPSRRAEIARELAGALIFSGHATEAAALLVRALDELEGTVSEPDPELIARLESLLLAAGVVTSGGHRIARSRYERIERRIAELPEPAARLVSAPLALERVTCGGTVDLGVHLARRALADGRLLAEEGPESPIVFVAMGALLWSDRIDEAEAAASAAIARTQAEGSARGLVLALSSRGLMRLRRGDLREAEADARMALELHAEAGGWEIFRMVAASTLAMVQIERGELDEPAAVLEQAGAVPHDPDAVLTQPLREARARLWSARGDAGMALRVLLACDERERAWGIRSVAPIAWRSQAATAYLALGDAESAKRLAEDELELARLFNAPRAIGLALRALGLIEGGDSGVELLREAEAALADSSDRLEGARAKVELGAAIRRSGRNADARVPLTAGLEAARACGASVLAERAYEELRATGARPRKILYSGVEALTPSERRVATMAADGMTNREIAQALFVTPKTVEVHLSHAYAKLEISSRKELPEALP